MESVKDAVKDRQKRGKTTRKLRYDSYMQWALCLMVRIVSVVIGFYLLQGCSPKFRMKSSIVNDRLGFKYTSALAYC